MSHTNWQCTVLNGPTGPEHIFLYTHTRTCSIYTCRHTHTHTTFWHRLNPVAKWLLFICFNLWAKRGWGQQIAYADPSDWSAGDYHKQFKCYWFNLLHAVIEHLCQAPYLYPFPFCLSLIQIHFSPSLRSHHSQPFYSQFALFCQIWAFLLALLAKEVVEGQSIVILPQYQWSCSINNQDPTVIIFQWQIPGFLFLVFIKIFFW